MKKNILCILLSLLVWSGLSASEDPEWITAVENQSATNTWLCFRKTYDIDQTPGSVLTRIAADSKYWLWVNGQLVVFEGGVKRGPDPRNTYYDELDLAPYLRKGKNLVSVLLWYFGKQGFSYNPSGCAALFIDGRDASGKQILKTDNSWMSMVHPAYGIAGNPMLNFRLPESNLSYDARNELGEWNADPDYTTHKKVWKESLEKGTEGASPWNKLFPRIIPMWKDYGLKDYVNTRVIKGLDYDTLVCKLPYNAQITPYLSIDATEGKLITMLTDHYRGGGPVNLRSEYITKKGLQEYESLGWINGHNIYYIYPKGVKINRVMYRETSYDTEFSGYFSCNDPFMNLLWEKARRTLLVTMRDTYMDCPDRERAQWWGDVVNESGEAFYALCPKSHLLMKKGMYELINWQKEDGKLFSPIPASNYERELPGQMLASVGYYGFWNYYMSTGDLKPVADLYPGIQRYLNLWKFNADGTVQFRTGDWTWGDWGSNIDKEVLYNAWYYIALKGVSKMADALGRSVDKNLYETQMMSLKEAFNKKFWNGKSYRHPSYTEETDDRVQALAVVSGIADPIQYPEIFETLKKQEFASPYMEKYVIEALFQMGYGQYGLSRLKRRFSEMVNDPDCSTLYEGWGIGIKGYGGGTKNHAWSGGGLTILSQYVCGVEPLTPGYAFFNVKPLPAGIRKASARIPSVAGNIDVSFTDEKSMFELSVTVPLGTKSRVVLPYAMKSVTCNGKRNSPDKPIELSEGSWKIKAVKKK